MGLLKGSGLTISEDITKQTRDKRTELMNFLREVKVKQPGLRYNLAYDRLYLEDKCFQWSPELGKVVSIEERRPVRSEEDCCQSHCIDIPASHQAGQGVQGSLALTTQETDSQAAHMSPSLHFSLG